MFIFGFIKLRKLMDDFKKYNMYGIINIENYVFIRETGSGVISTLVLLISRHSWKEFGSY